MQKVKGQYGIKFFGIWHALTGYWGGVDPGSGLAKRYDVLKSNGTIRPWEQATKTDSLYLVDPSQAERFFRRISRWAQVERRRPGQGRRAIGPGGIFTAALRACLGHARLPAGAANVGRAQFRRRG